MRILLALILAFPLGVFGAEVRLANCGTAPGSISEAAPLDLDACNLQNGDDITLLLTDISAQYGRVHVRAPSKTVWVYAGYTNWPATLDHFTFVEDQSRLNTMEIRHKKIMPVEKGTAFPSSGDYLYRWFWRTDQSKMYRCEAFTTACTSWVEKLPNTFPYWESSVDTSLATCSGQECQAFFTLWRFNDFDTVKIGGPNLSLTFKGTHPGLANCSLQNHAGRQVGYAAPTQTVNCDYSVSALMRFVMTGSNVATLADIRANFRYTQALAIQSQGKEYEWQNSPAIATFNVAGMFYATRGVTPNAANNIWFDPDRTVWSDPYVRTFGWTGATSGGTTAGLPNGCASGIDDEVRITSFSAYLFKTMTGGFTAEYGGYNWVIRLSGTIGTAEQPFTIRMRDWYVSGPGTAYPAGVRLRTTAQPILFKGDPANNNGTSPSRFVRWIKLPDRYGSGPTGASQSSTPCGESFGPDAMAYPNRFENSLPSAETRDYWFEFAGDWRTTTDGGTFYRGAELIGFGSSADTGANHSHTVRLASGTAIPSDTITLRDRSTVTGPGTWGNLSVSDASTAVQGQSSTITNTNVSGQVTLNSGTTGTTIRNVRFTGAARAVITNNGATGTVIEDLCVPSGSTIAGSGSVTYEGEVISSFPYSLPPNTQNCNITADGRPNPPGAN